MSKRKFTNEFKREAVNLVLVEGLKVAQAARDLGLNENTLHNWVGKERKGLLEPTGSKAQEQEELKRLRKENALLRQEREILKKATVYFAKFSG
jgi:transposase